MPQLSHIPPSQKAPLLPDLFPALSMLSSCYFQSSLWEARVKICCLRPTGASSMKTSKNNLHQKQMCGFNSSLLSSHLSDWWFPILGQNKNIFFSPSNFFILSYLFKLKISLSHRKYGGFSASHLLSGKV